MMSYEEDKEFMMLGTTLGERETRRDIVGLMQICVPK